MNFPKPIPGGSMGTSYGPKGITTNVEVPGAPYLASNLDHLLMGALIRPRPQPQASMPQQQMHALAPARESTTRTVGPGPLEYAPRPKDFGKFMMNQHGNWGNFVDAANVPVGSGIQPGFYGGLQNWDTSNPDIQGHPAYGKSGIAAGGGGNYGISSMQPVQQAGSNSGFDYLPKAEQLRWLEAAQRG